MARSSSSQVPNTMYFIRLLRVWKNAPKNGPRATQEKSIFGAVPGADRYLYEV